MASRKSKKRLNRGRQMTRPVPDKVRESPRNVHGLIDQATENGDHDLIVGLQAELDNLLFYIA